MKTKLLFIFLFVFCISLAASAQDTIAAWTFPTGTSADATPDFHNANNALDTISTQGGTGLIDFSKNGYSTKAAQATGWDGGANLKWWQIKVNTTNYNNLLLSSKQTAGGSYPGPRDWKAQYKLGSTGVWTDIPGTAMINNNAWGAELTNISMPVACNNQASVFVRWVMTSDTSIAPPSTVISTGTTKIDDIYILGSYINMVDEYPVTVFSVYPNPNSGRFIVSSNELISDVRIYNLLGKEVYKNQISAMNHSIDLSGIEKGICIMRYRIDGGEGYRVEKIVVE